MYSCDVFKALWSQTANMKAVVIIRKPRGPYTNGAKSILSCRGRSIARADLVAYIHHHCRIEQHQE